MSEARAHRSPREVISEPVQGTEASSVSARLAEFANTYVKAIGTFTVPFARRYNEGHRCNPLEARVIDWARINRAASVANSAVTRGKESKLDDAGKLAYITKYVNEYEFTDELGSEFASSLLETAADRLVFELGKAQKSAGFSGDYADNDNKEGREFRSKVRTRVLTDPAVADKYTPLIREMIDTILNERHEPQTRQPKGAKVEAELEL